MSWMIMVLPLLAMVVAAWNVGQWHLLSLGLVLCTLSILIDEAVAKWLSPEHKTLTNQMRDFRKVNPVMFWVIMTFWMTFAFFFVIHVAT